MTKIEIEFDPVSVRRWRRFVSFGLFPALIGTVIAAEMAPPFVANIAAFAIGLLIAIWALVAVLWAFEGKLAESFKRDIARHRAEKALGLTLSKAMRVWVRCQFIAFIVVMVGFGWWWSAMIACAAWIVSYARGQEIEKSAATAATQAEAPK